LYNSGLSDDELETYRQGLSKLVNSLSWGKRIAKPIPVDPSKTILRIDLRDLGWDEATWERILAANPYRVLYDSNAARAIQRPTGSRLPFVRADWFVDAASRPPLYHDILALPQTLPELEKQLRVDVGRDIRQERVARVGFSNSGVSRNNRMIERHESLDGSMWVSYDFAQSTGLKNLFEHPLGPRAIDHKRSSFEHDGGEIIFGLPNGLQAYMLVNAKGDRLDKGPTAIVSDPKRPDRAVENGISCMGCHVRGMIPKDDQIRANVLKNPNAFSDEEQRSVDALYPPTEKLKALFDDDSARFRKAIEACSVRVGQTEPINALALRFEAELDLATAASELDVSPSQLLKHLRESAALSRKLGGLTSSGGTIKRETFIEAFADAVREMDIGTVVKGSDRISRTSPKLVDLRTELREAKKRGKIVIHLLEPDPKGLIVGSGGMRWRLLCDPKRRFPLEGTRGENPSDILELGLPEPGAITCSRCRAILIDDGRGGELRQPRQPAN
jgi:hypothetical protein